MSRKIKFRAWDKGSKRYGEVVEIEYNESREISEVWVWYNIHERYEPIPGANAVVEQYTGLKDKNGKEIYEGDIVKMPEWQVDPRYEVVEYSTAGFDPFQAGCFECMSPDGEDTEVIGNVHENPELLEKGEEYE